MTEPEGRPHRRRRRPHRQGGTASSAAATGSPEGSIDQPAPVTGDGPAAAEAHQQAESAGGGPDGKQRRGHGGESGKGRRDGEPGRGHGRESERGWRELAGSSPSQVGFTGAMRARDVSRPTAEDLAAAERSVTVIRRHWQPPESTP